MSTGRHKLLTTRIIARDGKFVQLENVPGLLVEADIRPCQQCGGTMFAIGHFRLGCVACTKRYRDEVITGMVDLASIINGELCLAK